MSRSPSQAGFSAVELMISLFIAVAFVATGYQLYSVIVRDGAETRQRSQASSIAYSHLRTLSGKPSGPCNPGYAFSPVPALTTSERAQLPEPTTLTATVSCPYGSTSQVWRVMVKVTYGTPSKEIVHAVFVAR